MARRRFFVPEIRRGMAELTGSEAEHLVRVLRAEVGQVYELSDNRNLYLAEIETARKSLVSFRVLEELAQPPSVVHVTLLPALFKFDRFEWLVEKATELGVDAIQPFEANRTERGLMQASTKRTPRWQKLGNEASQQSRRPQLPVIGGVLRFAKTLQVAANVRIFLDEESTLPLLAALPAERKPTDHVAMMLGPEGGWTPEEREQATAANWTACSLGPTILRAETAGVAGLAAIYAAWLAGSEARPI